MSGNSETSLPSLLTLKKQLQDLGLSTSTNGLMGDDRYEELHNRLLKAKGLLSDRLSSSLSNKNYNNNVPESPLTQLTIGDIRSRLVDLGESTSTPGLHGEERRTELLRRLTTAICGSETDQTNAILDDMVDRTMKLHDEKIDLIPVKAPDPPAPINNENEINNLDSTITNGDISDIKKLLKRILNKRAIAIAARLSGTNQDPDLKEHEKNTSKVEAELARLRVQKVNSPNVQTSSVLIDGGVKMPIDRLMQRLENLKSESKEQIRIIRLKIRDEVDQHPEYGTAAEEELQAALRNANYTKGRTRRKIDEIKAMNSSKSGSTKGNTEIFDKNDDKLKSIQQKDFATSKSKTILPPTKVKSMENGLDSRWDSLEALGDRQKKEFEELMADLGHEEDLFDLQGLADEIVRPKTPIENSTGVLGLTISSANPCKSKRSSSSPKSAMSSSNSLFCLSPNASRLSHKEKFQSIPPINNKIIDHDGDGNDDINENYDEENSDDDDDEEDESATNYSPPPSAPQVLKEKPSLIKRLLEEQEKERQSLLSKRNELNINYSNDDDENDDDNKNVDDNTYSYENSDSGAKYISNIYENLQPVTFTAPGTPKSNSDSNDKDIVSSRAEEKSVSPRSESKLSSTKMISPVDTKPATILERRKPPPPNQPPTNRHLESPTNKAANKPNLSIDTNLNSRPVTAVETVSRPQSAPSTPKTPMSSKAGVISKEEADLKNNASPPNSSSMRHDSDSDDNDEEDSNEGDDKKQVRSLLKHAKVLEGLGDLVSAESMYSRALELNPLDISSLNSYAVFLHNKRGELTRAESFFGRAIHVLFPALYESVCVPSQDKIPKPPPLFDISDNKTNGGREDKPTDTKTKYKVVVNSLLNFAGFLSRAKGDIESAQIVYSKALQIASNDAKVLGIVGHFLSEEGGNSKKAAEILAKAMKIDPNNAKHAMWYAKVLKKQGKYGQAELMYIVAIQKSQDDKKIEPTAICNYATYIFKHKKDKVKAQQMFIEGLEKYPGHKGLVKNYSALLKANPHMGSSESLRQPTPMSAKSRLRVDSAIKAAMERINSPLVSAPGSSNLTRANSSSAFTFMATEFDSRVTSPDIVELKKIVERKLTPHATTRKSLKSYNNDEDDDIDANIKILPLETEKVVVEHSLDDVKDSWMKNGLFNNDYNEQDDDGDDNDDDDDDDDDLYGAPTSPFKK